MSALKRSCGGSGDLSVITQLQGRGRQESASAVCKTAAQNRLPSQLSLADSAPRAPELI